MSEALPPITLELDGEVSPLVRALGEATAAITLFTEVAEKIMNKGGKDAGEKFADGVKKEIEKDDFATSLGKSLRKLVSGVKGATSGVLGSLGTIAMPAMWTTLIYGASQAVAALAPAVGVLGLIPAAATAAAVSLVTLKMAFHGVGTALQAGAKGDMQAYAEALKKLAPAAQATVKEMVKLKPLLEDVRRTVQQNFFTGLAYDIKAIGERYLPLMRTELGGVAVGLNNMVSSLTGTARAPKTFADIKTIMDNVRLSVMNADSVLVNFFTILKDIARVGSTFLPGLSTGFSGLMARFAAFIDRISGDGTLAQWIQAGLDTLKLLTPLLKDAWNILSPIIKALQATGGGGLGILGTALHALAGFLNSAQGMATLTTIFSTLNSLFSVLGQVLAALLPAVSELVVALGPTLVALFVALAPVLIDAANALVVIVGWLAPLVTWLAKAGPLVTILGDAILGLLVPAIIAWTVNMAAAAVANIAATWEILLIIAAVAALGYGIYQLVKHWSTVWNWIKSIAGDVAGFFVMVWRKVQRAFDVAWGAIKDAAAAVGRFFKGIWDDVVGALSAALDWVEALPGKIWAGIQKLPALILRGMERMAYYIAFGIGWMIREFIDLPTQLGHIIRRMWDATYHLFVTGAAAVIDFMLALPGRILLYWVELSGWAYKTAVGMWHDITHAFSVGYHAVLDFFKKLPGEVGGFLAEMGKKVWSVLKGLPKVIMDALIGANKWLIDTGKDVVRGLINGVKSMFGEAVNLVSDLGHNMWSGFKKGLGISSPSTVFMTGGHFIVAGLVKGIRDRAGDAVSAVASLVNFNGGRGLAVPAFAAGGALGGGFVGGGGNATIQVHVHNYLDGKQLHAGLIQPAQRYKARTGTTGLT